MRIDADDYLYFIARRGDMIKTKSANVSRLEVEAALAALPEVATAVAAGLEDPDPEIGQLVVAAVVPKEGTSPTEEGLQAALRGTLSSFKIPRRIVFVGEEDIPRTNTGKLKLFELADMIASRIGKPAASAVAAERSMAK